MRLARRFSIDDADALDVLQETSLYLLRKIPTLQPTGRLTTLLYPVVRHIAKELARKRRRASGVTENDDLSNYAAAPQTPEQMELAAIVSSLPEAQREVLLMRFVDDMQLDEIAAALEIPVGTVKSRIHNALSTLRASPRIRSYFEQR